MNWKTIDPQNVPFVDIQEDGVVYNFYPNGMEQNEDNTKEYYAGTAFGRKLNLAELKGYLAYIIKEYDKSDAVCQFKFGEGTCWFDKATRVGLKNLIQVLKKNNLDYILIAFDNVRYDVDIDYMDSFLDELELYAYDVFKSTTAHLKVCQGKNLKSIEDILTYPFTSVYPTPITFDTTKLLKNA